MLKAKITRTKKARLNSARLVLGKATFDEIGKIASAAIVLNIKESRQADGAPIKRNKPSTALQKRMRRSLYRGRVAPLIDKRHRFIQGAGGSWRWFSYADHVNIEPATSELRQLSNYAQRNGYTGWFGVSKKAWSLIRRVVRRRLTEIVRTAT